jgi:hypothetical protein
MSTPLTYHFSAHGEPVEPFLLIMFEPFDKLRVSGFDSCVESNHAW